MNVSRRQAAKTLGALLLAPAGFMQSERQYDLELMVSSDKSDKPLTIPLKGTASQVRRAYENAQASIPFNHLDTYLWVIASNLASDPHYFASNFESNFFMSGLTSNKFTDEQFFASFLFDTKYNLHLVLSGFVSDYRKIQLAGMRLFEINDGYMDKRDHYGYKRTGDENFEVWVASNPETILPSEGLAIGHLQGWVYHVEIKRSSQTESLTSTGLDELDLTGIRTELLEGLKYQIIFVDENWKIVKPQYDEKGKLMPPYGGA